MARMMYEDPRFQPDFVKIYPAQVIAGTELFREWERGEYRPYSDEELLPVLRSIKLLTPPTVRIDRLVRDISKKWVSAGTKATNMRQYILKQLAEEGLSCHCIRCREVRERPNQVDAVLIKRQAATLGGQDIMLSYELGNQLFSLLRLRLPDLTEQVIFPELAGCAIIREIHTFGRTAQVGELGTGKTQHQGFGTKLIAEAERQSKDAGYAKIAVISSIGTRGYYRKFGYVREGLYMTKSLK